MRRESNLIQQLGQLAMPMAKCGDSVSQVCASCFCDLNESTHLNSLKGETAVMKRVKFNN